MGKRSTITGYWRAFGDSTRSSTPGILTACLTIRQIDATLPGTEIETGYRLPPDSNVFRIDVWGKGTGGTAPLLDIGIIAETGAGDVALVNSLVDGAAADARSSVGLGDAADGGGLGGFLSYPSRIIVSDGGGTNATGGTIDLLVHYTFRDEGDQ